MGLREKYAKDGFLELVDVFTKEEADQIYSGYTNYVAKYGCKGRLEGDFRFRLHVVSHWARNIVFAPKLVEAVKEVLGTKDLLCWDCDVNIKPPSSQAFYSWHQDGTYSGHSPASGVVTAWLAISPAPIQAGCLQFRPGSHHKQLPHKETRDPINLLAVGQTIPPEVLSNLNQPVVAPLQPGQASLHHWQCVHASGPNTTDTERIGLAVRYIRPDVTSRRRGGVKERVTLVAGEYHGDEWELEEPLEEEYGDKEWARHREGAEREKANYFVGTQSSGFK